MSADREDTREACLGELLLVAEKGSLSPAHA